MDSFSVNIGILNFPPYFSLQRSLATLKCLVYSVKSSSCGHKVHYGTNNTDIGQVPFLICTLEIPQKLQYKFFALNFCYLYFLTFSQTMSLSCIFVFAPSFIPMDLSIVTSSTSLTFPEFLVLFSSISLLFSFIESHFALSSARCHL